jgi:hypothetical protein
VSNEFEELFDTDDPLMFKDDATRDSYDVSMLYYKQKIVEGMYMNIETLPVFRVIYEQTNVTINRALSEIGPYKAARLNEKTPLYDAMIKHGVDLPYMYTIYDIQDYIRQHLHGFERATIVRDSFRVLATLWIQGMLSVSEILTFVGGRRKLRHVNQWTDYVNLYAIDPWTYYDSDGVLTKTTALDDAEFQKFRGDFNIIDQLQGIVTLALTGYTIHKKFFSDIGIYEFWHIIRNSQMTARQIRRVWQYATCMFSLLFQSRTPWNNIFPENAPIDGVLVYRGVYHRFNDVVIEAIGQSNVVDAINQVFMTIDHQIFKHTGNMLRANANISPVYLDILHPYALIYLVMDTATSAWTKPDNPHILKHMCDDKCGLYTVLNCFLPKPCNKVSSISSMLFPSINTQNRLECCAFAWLLSRLLIGDHKLQESRRITGM